MKRKDFLRKMRDRRRGDAELERREPERRRAIDWRTLRVELPSEGETEQPMAVGVLTLRHDGLQLRPAQPCWVRGYRRWEEDDGSARAEFQYRPAEEGRDPPHGATAVATDATWAPPAAR